MNTSVRLATKNDIPKLEALITLSARGLSKGYYTQEQIESAIKYIFGIDSQLLEDQTYYLVEVEGNLVGCGGWSKRETLFGGDQFKKSKPDPLINPKLTEEVHSIRISISPAPGENVLGNNSKTVQFALTERGIQSVAVPETNYLLLPIIVLIVLLIINSEKKRIII